MKSIYEQLSPVFSELGKALAQEILKEQSVTVIKNNNEIIE